MKNKIIALLAMLDIMGKKTFGEFAQSDTPLKNRSLLAEAVIATQPIMPMPLGQNFGDMQEDGTVVPVANGQYGVKVTNEISSMNKVQVVLPENKCVPTGGDCEISCDGFSTSYVEQDKILDFEITNPICSPGGSFSGEAFIEKDGITSVSQKFRNVLQKELVSMDAQVSKYIYEKICELADVPFYDEVPHIQPNGSVSNIHTDIFDEIELPINLIEYFGGHELENPYIIDTGALMATMMKANFQSTSTDESGTNINAWNSLNIYNAFKEFKTRKKKVVAFEPGALALAGYSKHNTWHKINGDDNYWAGPIFSQNLPVRYDIYYKRECKVDAQGDPTMYQHSIKLKFYCELFKRPSSCDTKADVLLFEKKCFTLGDECSETPTCNDVTVAAKQHQEGPLTVTIPSEPIMLANGATIEDGSKVTICKPTNNYNTPIVEIDYNELINGDYIQSFEEAGNYRLKYNLVIKSGELICNKLIKVDVCVLPCGTEVDAPEVE